MSRILAGMDHRFAEILLPKFPLNPEEGVSICFRKFGKQTSKYLLTNFPAP